MLKILVKMTAEDLKQYETENETSHFLHIITIKLNLNP